MTVVKIIESAFFRDTHWYVDGAWNAHFLYRDWQGNVVLTVDGDNNVKQMVGYYPYGEPWREPWGQRQTLFVGKERQHGQLSGDWDFGPRHLSSPSMLWSAPDVNATDNPWWSPWAYCGGNPVRYVDPNGQDVLITVDEQNITITAEIILYGKDADETRRKIYEEGIKNIWGKINKYKPALSDKVYNVSWDVNVRLMDIEEKGVLDGVNNYVEVVSDPAKLWKFNRSAVRNSNYGQFRSYGRDGRTLAEDNPAPHEFGHMMGLEDLDKSNGFTLNERLKNDIMNVPAYSNHIEVSNLHLNKLFEGSIKRYEMLAPFYKSIYSGINPDGIKVKSFINFRNRNKY